MATSQSTELRSLAQRLADALPPVVDEIVLTGGVARGVADAWSDVELLVVHAPLPSLGQVEEWAVRVGATITTRFADDELAYVAGTYEDTMVELVWLVPGAIDALLDRAFAGELVDHARLRTCEALEQGIALRGGEHLRTWQTRLATYPVSLRTALILDAIDDWGGYPLDAYLRQAHRDDRYALVKVVLEVAEDVLRLLFALNCRWEPSWKRLAELLAPLERVPPNAAARIESALTEPDPRSALLEVFEIARDSVAPLDAELDVSRARTWLDEAVAALQ